MSATDQFVAGKSYSAIVEISALTDEGFAFSGTKGLINGEEEVLYDSNTVNVLYYRVVYDVDENYNGDFYFSITKFWRW